jgi:uncharacterized protein
MPVPSFAECRAGRDFASRERRGPKVFFGTRRSLKRAIVWLGLLAFWGALLPAVSWGEKVQDLRPQGYVSDFAHVLNSDASNRLSNLCLEVQQKTGAQIAVVTIETLDDQPIEDFASKLYQQWGIGPKNNNRGVLILLVTRDHRYRVEVGYGLEPILPDGKVGGFGREAVPLLRQGDNAAALWLMTRRVADVIAQDKGVTLDSGPEPQAPETDDDDGGRRGVGFPVILLIFLGFSFLRFIFSLFRRGPRRRGSWWPWIIGPWIGGGGGGGWSGGGFGGGGGGFGGFGGGMSGGGGASGSW